MGPEINNSFLKKLSLRSNYDLFGSDIHENLHWGKIFLQLFDEFFSRYSIYGRFNNPELINFLIKRYSLKQDRVLRIDRTKDEDSFEIEYEYSEILLILKDGFMINIISNRIELLYGPDISDKERKEVIKIVDEYRIAATVLKKFHMVQQSNGYLELTDFDIKPFHIDLATHYNDDFAGIHELIIKSLGTRDKNGLVLLHGKYGSGKTYYLRHLISTIERKFIYFPSNMVEAISSPEFLPFISRQPDSVLILEDCESLLVHRENSSVNASALSNLLNLGDGLLSDALSINVICTFNTGLKKLDDAILRKGRLLARYEFKELETAKANYLAHIIGKDVTIEHPMTVADIYNMNEKGFENATVKSIGFSN